MGATADPRPAYRIRNNYPRSAQRVITCAACGREGKHKSHGWCNTCESRWIYYGRPASGPPAVGEGLPSPDSVAHSCGGTGDPQCPRCELERAWQQHLAFVEKGRGRKKSHHRRQSQNAHQGHNFRITQRGAHCLTCRRGELTIDDIAVERAVMGEPPAGLTYAERQLAVVRLRDKGLSYAKIADRLGCSDRTALRLYQEATLTQDRMEVAA